MTLDLTLLLLWKQHPLQAIFLGLPLIRGQKTNTYLQPKQEPDMPNLILPIYKFEGAGHVIPTEWIILHPPLRLSQSIRSLRLLSSPENHLLLVITSLPLDKLAIPVLSNFSVGIIRVGLLNPLSFWKHC